MDIEELLTLLGDVLEQYFKPVETLQECERWIDTDEVFEAIQALLPSADYGPREVAMVLTERKFKFAPVPGPALQFAWLMVRR